MNASLHSEGVSEPVGPAREPPRATKAASIFLSLVRTFPALLVLVTLAGLGYWGHHTGWTLPKFSALAGTEQEDNDDWCNEHDVPESQCVECNPGLLPKTKEFGWCRKHGVPECVLDHPELTQRQEKPGVYTADLARVAQALEFRERPENNPKCKLHLRRIQFASREAFEKAGIEVEPVWQAPMQEAVSANGEITYDPTRVARLSSRVAGTVWRAEKKVGDTVVNGEILALVDAAEVGKAKAEFLQAIALLDLKDKNLQSIREAVPKGAIPEVRLREAEAAAREARIRLLSAQQALVNLGLPITAEDLQGLSEEQLTGRVRFLGLPEALAASLDPKTTPATLVPIKVPFGGVIVAREVVAGEVLDTTKVLFVVADVSHLWLTLDVRVEDAQKLALGQFVRFRTDASAAEVQGSLSWISTAVDQKTRTLKVRADLPTPGGRLPAHSFGTGQIVLREDKNAVVVPNEAVHWEGDCHVVFVRDKDFLRAGAPKVFHVRKVRPGAKDEKYTEIIAGALPGEVVATKGSGVLRAELLKNNLGEG